MFKSKANDDKEKLRLLKEIADEKCRVFVKQEEPELELLQGYESTPEPSRHYFFYSEGECREASKAFLDAANRFGKS